MLCGVPASHERKRSGLPHPRHHSEGSCLFETDRQTRDGQFGSGVVVVLQHRGVIHSVDVISRENQRILGAASLQQVEVLVDGVRRAAVPRFSRPHLRGPA